MGGACPPPSFYIDLNASYNLPPSRRIDDTRDDLHAGGNARCYVKYLEKQQVSQFPVF